MSKPSLLLRSAVKYTVAAILIAVPLLPKFPFLSIPGTFVAVRLEDLVLAFAAILVVLLYLPKLNDLLKDNLNQAIIIFLFTGLLSVFSAIFLTHTVEPHLGFLHWVRRIEYLIPFFLGMAAVKMDRDNFGFFIKVLLIVLSLVFIYGYGQKNFNWPIIITQNEEYSKGVALRYIPGGHINSTFAGHYDLASFLVMVLPFVITAVFLQKEKIFKVIFTAVSGLSLWLLVNTASRISLAAYLVAVTLSLILVRKYKALIAVLFVSIVFVGFSTSLISRYERLYEITTQKLNRFNLINYVNKPVLAAQTDSLPQKKIHVTTPTPTPVFEDRSTNIRLNVEWPRALRAFAKNPLLGTGYSSITLATDNDYLRLLGEVGIAGFLAFFLIFARVLILFLHKFPFTKHYSGLELAFIAGIFASLPAVFLNAFFIDVFEASKFATLFWLLMGFSIALLVFEKHERDY